MGRQQGIAGHRGSHLAIAEDEMRQDGAYRFARGALETPDGDAPETDTHIMRVTRQAPAATTGRLVLELKTDGQNESQHQSHKGLAVAKQLKVGRFVLKINSDGPIVAGLVGGVSHGSSSGPMVSVADDPKWGNAGTISRGSRWGRPDTTKFGGMWLFPVTLSINPQAKIGRVTLKSDVVVLRSSLKGGPHVR